MQVRKISIENIYKVLAAPDNFWYKGHLCEKKTASKLNFDCIGTFRNIWWKPNFTPEQFFNQSDMAQDKIWRHKINAAAWKTEKIV